MHQAVRAATRGDTADGTGLGVHLFGLRVAWRTPCVPRIDRKELGRYVVRSILPATGAARAPVTYVTASSSRR